MGEKKKEEEEGGKKRPMDRVLVFHQGEKEKEKETVEKAFLNRYY